MKVLSFIFVIGNTGLWPLAIMVENKEMNKMNSCLLFNFNQFIETNVNE
jgi:hypothetical protein